MLALSWLASLLRPKLCGLSTNSLRKLLVLLATSTIATSTSTLVDSSSSNRYYYFFSSVFGEVRQRRIESEVMHNQLPRFATFIDAITPAFVPDSRAPFKVEVDM